MDTGRTRVALVTGGARGIGAVIAARLANDGYSVVVADQDRSGRAPHRGRHILCNVADEAAVQALVSDIGSTEQRLDVLVCNAGIMVRKPIAQLSLTEWRLVLDTNLTSTFMLVRAAEDLLRAAKGCVVTIASTRARMSEPNTEAYAASKGGLVALTHALALSLGPDVRVNCISPGWIFTKGDPPRPEDHAFHPSGRVGTPQDIAAMVAFLAGSDNGFITGAEFIIDGGVTRKMIYPE
ncbi:MAG: SDR family oxidoreductase [Acetobacteraceae bacterium]|nr:SDR family oxidoreductase [Acetobacteraceae bacterium]